VYSANCKFQAFYLGFLHVSHHINDNDCFPHLFTIVAPARTFKRGNADQICDLEQYFFHYWYTFDRSTVIQLWRHLLLCTKLITELLVIRCRLQTDRQLDDADASATLT